MEPTAHERGSLQRGGYFVEWFPLCSNLGCFPFTLFPFESFLSCFLRKEVKEENIDFLCGKCSLRKNV